MVREKISKETMLDGAQMALTALIAGTLGFLKERGIPARDWLSYMGEQFNGALGDLEGEDVSLVMEHLLTLQILPLGTEVISSNGSPEKAEAVLTTLPSRGLMEKFGTTPDELLGGFNISEKEFESIYTMFEPAAKAIRLHFKHQIRDGKELLILEKAT